LLTDLGFVARNEGIASLAPLIDEIDYPLLRRSLQLLVDSGDLHAQSARWGAKHRRIWSQSDGSAALENRLFVRRQ
jgi:hypothetical protein